LVVHVLNVNGWDGLRWNHFLGRWFILSEKKNDDGAKENVEGAWIKGEDKRHTLLMSTKYGDDGKRWETLRSCEPCAGNDFVRDSKLE